MDRGAWRAKYSLWGHKRVGHDLATKQQQKQDVRKGEGKWHFWSTYVPPLYTSLATVRPKLVPFLQSSNTRNWAFKSVSKGHRLCNCLNWDPTHVCLPNCKSVLSHHFQFHSCFPFQDVLKETVCLFLKPKESRRSNLKTKNPGHFHSLKLQPQLGKSSRRWNICRQSSGRGGVGVAWEMWRICAFSDKSVTWLSSREKIKERGFGCFSR